MLRVCFGDRLVASVWAVCMPCTAVLSGAVGLSLLYAGQGVGNRLNCQFRITGNSCFIVFALLRRFPAGGEYFRSHVAS